MAETDDWTGPELLVDADAWLVPRLDDLGLGDLVVRSRSRSCGVRSRSCAGTG